MIEISVIKELILLHLKKKSRENLFHFQVPRFVRAFLDSSAALHLHLQTFRDCDKQYSALVCGLRIYR